MKDATLVLGCDLTYFKKAKNYFKSIEKNWKGRVCCLCIDFAPSVGWEFEFATCELEDLKSYRKNFPQNRDFFVCVEGGEFLSYFDFTHDELIVHTDMDMVLQREFFDSEMELFKNIKQGEIGMSGSTKPITYLREEYYRLRPNRSYLKTNNDYKGNLGEIPLYCTALIAARKETYKKMSKLYLNGIDTMTTNFNHHAAGQWIFSYYAKNFKVIDLGNTIHNASWFIDTEVTEDENYLYHNGEKVLFNHTKFIKEYAY